VTLSIERISWHPQRLLQAIGDLEHEANRRAGERLLDSANGLVPMDTGELADSGMVEVDAGEATVSYGTDHAIPVRAKGRALGGRDAHWLEDAIQPAEGEITSAFADTLRSGWPSG
jgi:hypothetical protein